MSESGKQCSFSVNASVSFLDLHKDVLMNLCIFLDTCDILKLVQVCKALKDILYDPIFWRNTVPWLSYLSQEIADGLKSRHIRAIKLTEQCDSLSSTLCDRVVIDAIHSLVIPYPLFQDIQINENMRANLSGLRCLMLEIDVPFDDDMPQLTGCFKNLFLMLSQLTELHICIQSIYNLDDDMELFQLLASSNLVNLKDFEITRIDTDHLDVEYMPLEFEHLGGMNLERLAGVEIPAKHASELPSVSERFPKLKHLVLGYGKYNEFKSKDTLEEHKIKSVQSLTVICNWIAKWCNFIPLLRYLPNLVAIDLTCEYKDCLHSSIDVDHLCEVGALFPNLAVLKLPRSYPYIMQSDVLNLSRMMKNLEILVLPPTKHHAEENGLMTGWIDRYISLLCEQLPKLRSVIGIHSDKLDDFPNLMYKSSPCKYDHTLARQTDISYERSRKQSGSEPATKVQKVSRWKALSKNTKEWHNAHGTLYFYPETSICNLRFTQEEKSVFKDRFLDDWSKVDEDSDKESHSDNDEDQEKDDD